MRDLGIQKPFLQTIETTSPQSKNYVGIRKLFTDYLTKLNVPFFDTCCPAASEPGIFPLRFDSNTPEIQYFDGTAWQTASVGGASRFAVVGEDDNAAEERAFAMNNHSFSIGGGSQLLLQFDSQTFGSASEGAMLQLSWNTQQPRIEMGDLGNWTNQTTLVLDDLTQNLVFQTELASVPTVLLNIDGATEIVRIGAPATTTFEMNNTNALIRMWSGTGLWFLISGTGGSGIVRLGDMNNTANSTIAQLTDNAGTFDLSSVGLPPAYSIQGAAGASGTFTAQSGETITVSGGIITAITP